jgi:hypothetical protein
VASFCGDCGSPIGEGAVFCGSCGIKTTEAASDTGLAGGQSTGGGGWEGALAQMEADVGSTVESLGSRPVPSVPAGNPSPADVATGGGLPGRPRPIGTLILLFIVTLGFYSYFWAYVVHEELKTFTGRGVGGLVGLLLWLFVSPVVAFLLPYEIEQAYTARDATSRVRVVTGFWILLPLVGGIVWFVKVQGAMNRLWAGS